MARKESAVINAYRLLTGEIKHYRANGYNTIPSERALAEKFGVCRVTVRKAIKKAIACGLLTAEKKIYYINPDKNKIISNIAFVSWGMGVPFNKVWSRVMFHLQQTAEKTNFRLKPFLFSFGSKQLFNSDDIFRHNEVIILTHKKNIPFENMKNKIIIATDEAFDDGLINIISIDNYRAGVMAADYLVSCRKRKIACITRDFGNNYRPFELRAGGFSERAQSIGNIKFKVFSIAAATGYNYLEKINRLVPELAKNYNGIFIYSDEDMRSIYGFFKNKNYNPEIITLMGSGDLENHHIPIAYLDHAEKAIAEEIMTAAQTLLDNPSQARIKILIPPRLHRNLL
ncbi:MAG: hypothetical protein A2096_13185 [Spirochaetes bacterium GWF1_41_5]|nr:MAG: hypothetical protein A2096_13185 [Spirochaetes bacterium GWF1_41_5]HBE03565.1 hypothetical protein [Spirochaetia bacterium]